MAAVTEVPNVTDQAKIEIPVGATITETVNISVSWGWGADQAGEQPSFAFTWDATNHKWTSDSAAATLTFKAKNEGSGDKQVSIAKDESTVPAWLTVGNDGTQGKTIAKTAEDGTATYGDLCSYSINSNAASISDSAKPTGDTEQLSFTVTIADVVAP